MEDLHNGTTQQCHSHLIQRRKISPFWLSGGTNGLSLSCVDQSHASQSWAPVRSCIKVHGVTIFSKYIQMHCDVTWVAFMCHGEGMFFLFP